MTGTLIFAAFGFACCVIGVLLFLWSEDRSMRKEFQMIGSLKSDVFTMKKELEQKSATLNWLMSDRNKMHLENKCLKEEVEKLQDNYSAQISTQRELSIRQESVEKQKPAIPSTIEIVFVDKPRQTVSQFKPKERGQDEQKQTPKTNRATKSSAKGNSALGRSYRDVERSNSKRVPTDRKRGQGLNL